MITLGDAILAINPDAVFEYEDIDSINWRKKTRPISKDEILAKYKELLEIEKERKQLELSSRPSFLGKIVNYCNRNKVIIYNYRQALATSSIIVSLIFVLTNNFHKVRYTILTDPYGTEFVYDRFTGKLKKKISY
ncbi:MAG: hypothetical protein CMP24_05650 [Rickettsiales bacterium]|nr:hypothetical protein [Rickettsiales bacterium]|tara:strand:- start:514 stop:918 length:405 start_codon:yes stop_codon:yes gene_type:complete